MIPIKTAEEIVRMRVAGRILARALQEVAGAVEVGITTARLDQLAEESLLQQGAAPAFKGYRGYPATLCVSINEEVVHGIPGNRSLKPGDLVSLDLGAMVEGYFSDAATTVVVGKTVSSLATNLLKVGRDALYAGIRNAKAGLYLGDISAAIQEEAERHGFSVVRDFVGHGIGQKLHEEPQVPNFGRPATGILLVAGMTLAIEPMVNAGTAEVFLKRDNWTVVTRDHRPSVHFEHTVLVGTNGPEILTEWK